MHLVTRGRKIADIQSDFEDGILLIILLEIIGGEEIGNYNRNPKLRTQKIENINIALAYIKKKNINLPGISAEDITNNIKMVFGVIWSLILRFSISIISEEELIGKEALLLWCKKKTDGYNNVAVENFTTSWKDGLALCAIIHAHRPDLIPIGSFDGSSDARTNLQLAFDVAEKYLGIPPLVDIEDFVDEPRPDERSVITYIAQFYHCFSGDRQLDTTNNNTLTSEGQIVIDIANTLN